MRDRSTVTGCRNGRERPLRIITRTQHRSDIWNPRRPVWDSGWQASVAVVPWTVLVAPCGWSHIPSWPRCICGSQDGLSVGPLPRSPSPLSETILVYSTTELLSQDPPSHLVLLPPAHVETVLVENSRCWAGSGTASCLEYSVRSFAESR